MWIFIVYICIFSLCCGFYFYQYYLEYNDPENVYGSGAINKTTYNTALSGFGVSYTPEQLPTQQQHL